MKRRFLCLFLALLMILSLAGCGETAGEIAGSVADAAVKELKNQVQQLLEKNKLEVVEMKTVFGKLNDEGGKQQLFIAALVRANSASGPQAAANAMAKLFSDAGLTVQTTGAFTSDLLVHKRITFKHEDFSGGNYYVIWGYAADLSVSLPDLSGLLSTLGKS